MTPMHRQPTIGWPGNEVSTDVTIDLLILTICKVASRRCSSGQDDDSASLIRIQFRTFTDGMQFVRASSPDGVTWTSGCVWPSELSFDEHDKISVQFPVTILEQVRGTFNAYAR